MTTNEYESVFIQGISSPYDSFWNHADDVDGYRDLPMTPARCAALAIIADLTDRRGIKRGFEDLDEEICAEIVDALTGIIEASGDAAFLAHVVAKAEAEQKRDAERWARFRPN